MAKHTTTDAEPLAVCVGHFSTIFERLQHVVDAQARIAETVYGNGRPGLDVISDEHTRQISEIIKLMQETARIKIEETQTKEQHRHERQMELRRFWLSIALLSVTTVVAAIQAVALFAIGVK